MSIPARYRVIWRLCDSRCSEVQLPEHSLTRAAAERYVEAAYARGGVFVDASRTGWLELVAVHGFKLEEVSSANT